MKAWKLISGSRRSGRAGALMPCRTWGFHALVFSPMGSGVLVYLYQFLQVDLSVHYVCCVQCANEFKCPDHFENL